MKEAQFCTEYSNLKEAMISFTEVDVDYNWVWHMLEPEEGIELDIHDINEWIVIDSGKCEVTLEGEKYYFDADATENVLVVGIPKGKEHGFIAKSKMTYIVLKSK